MEYIYHYNSPLGGITLASDGNSLIGLWFDQQKYYANTLGTELEERELPVFKETVKWLDIYFSGRSPDFTPQLSLKITEFRKYVCEIMMKIPFGQTMTYGEIANIISKNNGKKRMSAQAVGGAVGHNPISIIIPCHRVIGSDGKLTGYAGGIDKKLWLLKLENVDLS